MTNTNRTDDAGRTTSNLPCAECGQRGRQGENVEYVDGQTVTTRWTCDACLGQASVNAAHQELTAKFAELKVEFPAITFGYIGNIYNGPYYDDRSWYIFLPHPGRLGQSGVDSVGGYSTASLPKMLADWDKLVARVRTQMVGR